jgi:hypothetical protein
MLESIPVIVLRTELLLRFPCELASEPSLELCGELTVTGGAALLHRQNLLQL